MNTPVGAGAALLPQDANHLNLLSIFHYVYAGFGLLGGAGLVGHYFLMNAIMRGEMGGAQNQSPPPPEVFVVLQVMYVVLGFLLALGIVLNVLSGVFLRQRRHRVFSMVVAGLNCVQVPLGTTLGVFTLVVLMRESVRSGYAQVAPQN